MSREYQVHEFAELAGVTVKALHHYDRLELLKPRRTDAGYRVYTLRDLERLEQIVALKFLSIPLRQIKRLLDRDVLELPDVLRLQRRELEAKRQLIDRAITAIENAEEIIQPGKPVDSLALRKILEVIGMQGTANFMRKYYSEEGWAKWKARHDHWPSGEWLKLLGDVQQSLTDDPEGETGQALATRWIQLRDSESGGDPAVLVGFIKTWFERRNWPLAMHQRFSNLDIEAITRFVERAIVAHRKKYYSNAGWEKLLAESEDDERERRSLERLDLWLQVGASLDEDPASEKAQALLDRWMEFVHESTGGDLELKAGALKAWADRQNWPAAMQQEISSFNLEKVAAFIGQAHAAHEKKYYSEEAWAKKQELFIPGSRMEIARAWNALYADIRSALEEDPASATAQALADNWMELVEKTTRGDPEIKTAATKAWQDRKNWPAWKKRQTAAAELEELSAFIAKALDAPAKKYFSEEGWAKRMDRAQQQTADELQQIPQARADLFHDIKAALSEDPASKTARVLANRWKRVRDAEAGNDRDISEGKSKAWADRPNWPLAFRLKEATSYGLSLEDFERAADFIDEAVRQL